MKKYGISLLIIVAGIFCYSTSLSGNFLWDDTFLVKNNPHITSVRHIPDLFTEVVSFKTQRSEMFWRPLQTLSYMVDYHLWKYNVIGYHLINLLLHILTALCVYRLAALLFGGGIIAGFSALLFTVHPVQTESVSYISDRADLLAALFVLLTIIAFVRYQGTKKLRYFAGMIVVFALALLSKENALITPFILLLHGAAFRNRAPIKEAGTLIGMAGMYVALRLFVLKGAALTIGSFAEGLERIPGFFVAIAQYLKLLALPVGLHAGYGRQTFSWHDPVALAGIAFTVIALAYAVRVKAKSPAVFFSLCWFFLALLPTANIYSISFFMAEHFLYLPSIGLFFAAGMVVDRWYQRAEQRRYAVVAAGLLLVICAALTIRQNRYWTLQPIEFYKETLKHSPDEPMLHNNLAQEYYLKGDIGASIPELRRTLELNSSFPGTHGLLALCYLSVGEKGKAKEVLNSYLSIDSAYAPAYYLLGSVYSDEGDFPTAIIQYRGALRASARYAEAYCALAESYRSTGLPDSARTAVLEGIAHCPEDARLYNTLGLVYGDVIDYNGAVTAFNKALSLNPGAGNTSNNLAALYFQMGDIARAREFADRAMALGYKVNPEFISELQRIGK